MDKPRLLFVDLGNTFGGGQVYIKRLVRLIGNEFRIDLIAVSGELLRQIRLDGLCSCGRVFNLPLFIRVFIIVLFNRYSVIVLNGNRETVLLPLLKVLGAKVVVVRHTDLDLGGSFSLKGILFRKLVPLSDAVVCVSRVVANKVNNLLGDGATKRFQIPSWVDDGLVGQGNDVSAVKPRQTCNKIKRLNIGIVARLDVLKGHLDLFAACIGLEMVWIHVFGVGQDECVMRSYAAEHGLSNITFHGFNPEPKNIYNCFDVLCHPSHIEGGRPLAVIEAMTFGKIVFASNLPVIREVVEDGVNGILFQPKNVAEIREKIKYIFENYSLIVNRMGESARLTASMNSERTRRLEWHAVLNEA